MTTAEKMEKSSRPPKKRVDGRVNNGGARPGAGRPAFVPTDAERKQVEALSGVGLPFPQIAVLIRDGIDDHTLRKYFEVELSRGKAKANAKIGGTIYNRAMSGDTTAAIWWSKCQMGWKEPPRQHELTGKDGGNVGVDVNMKFKGLSEAELTQMESLLEKVVDK